VMDRALHLLAGFINHCKSNKVTVAGSSYSIAFNLCSDLVSMHTSQGLQGLTAHQCCIYCHANRKEGDFSHVVTRAARRDFNSAKRKFGHLSKPALPMDAKDIVFDELHCFLRITHVLLLTLIEHANLEARKDALLSEFRRMSLSLKFFKNLHGGAAATSFTRRQKRRWVCNIDFSQVFKSQELSDHWDDTIEKFETLFNSLVYESGLSQQNLRKKAQALMDALLKVVKVDQREYRIMTPQKITPYLHILISHGMEIYATHGPLKKFSCTAVEHANMRVKLTWNRLTTRGGCGQNSLLQAMRSEILLVVLGRRLGYLKQFVPKPETVQDEEEDDNERDLEPPLVVVSTDESKEESAQDHDQNPPIEPKITDDFSASHATCSSFVMDVEDDGFGFGSCGCGCSC
jgi:hypothetical protein